MPSSTSSAPVRGLLELSNVPNISLTQSTAADNAGADGLVIWGYTGGDFGIQSGLNKTYSDYIKSTTGPMTAAFQEKVNACAEAHCSGHGRCVAVDPTGAKDAAEAAAACACFEGFSGADCGTAAP